MSDINPDQAAPKAIESKQAYGPALALSAVFVSLILIPLFAGLIVGGVGGIFFDWDFDNPSTSFVFLISLFSSLTIIYFIWILLKARGLGFGSIGLSRKPNVKDAALAVGIFLIYLGVLLTVTSLIRYFLPGIDADQEQQLGFSKDIAGQGLVLVFIALVILPPLMEEILIRGFLYTGLRAKLNKIAAAIIASIVFGVAHLQLGSGAPPLWIVAVDTFILSLFLIYLRERTGSIWSGIFVHGIKNGLAFLVLFIVK